MMLLQKQQNKYIDNIIDERNTDKRKTRFN